MSERLTRLRRDARYALRDGLDSWRALPRRRQAGIAAGLLAAAALALSASFWFMFRGKGPTNDGTFTEVTLYTSVDIPVYTPVVEEFERSTGLKVRIVSDTEATKTTGLVERLLAERTQPRADVWWSSEPLGTVTLARAGLLEPFASKAEAELGKAWPAALRGADRTWYGIAQRARVIAYNTNRIAKPNAPTRLRDLTRSEYAGKVGMARPQFGTTRTHLAALVALHGGAAVREWAGAMRANNLRLYDGNSAVVNAIAHGEIEVGLTDSDDVLSAKRNTWPVEMVFEAPDKPGAVRGLPSIGPLVLANTVAMLRAAPHPNEARRLADFLLSAKVEEMLATGDSGNFPIRADLAKRLGLPEVPNPASVDAAEIAKALAETDRLIAEFFPIQ